MQWLPRVCLMTDELNTWGIHLYIVVEEAEAGFAIYDHETNIKHTMHNKYMLTSKKRSSLTLFVMPRHSVHAFRKKNHARQTLTFANYCTFAFQRQMTPRRNEIV